MKKLLLAAIAVLTVFAGCKKDEGTITKIEFVEGKTINMEVLDDIILHIKSYPENLYDPTKYKSIWTSSNTAVATVDKGVVEALSVGESTITVSISDNISTSCRVVVKPIEILPSFKLDNNSNYEVLVGEIIQLKPSISGYLDKKMYKLVYTSTNDAVAKVGNDGKIETIGAGECQIKVEIVGTEISKVKEPVTTIYNIKVLPDEVTNIILDNKNVIIDKGESYTFEVEFEPKIITNKTIKWISSNTDVATIDENGILTGVGYGECTITAISSNNEVTAECKVRVSSVRGFEIDKSSLRILIGSTDNITANIRPATANQNVIWTSSDESIATVENGVVTGVAVGTATITATTEDGLFHRNCEVTICGITMFISAQNGDLTATFTNVGVYTYVSCEISNNSSVDVYVKSVSIDGNSISVEETLNSTYKLSKNYHTYSAESVVWIIEYDGEEYEIHSFWDPTFFVGFVF